MMFLEKKILDKMESYEDDLECAEAWFLASQNLDPKYIRRILRIKYESARGYAKLIEDLKEMSEYKIVSTNYGIKLKLEDESINLENAPVTDVDDDFSNVVKNAFLVKIEPKLRDELRRQIPNLPKEAKLLAEILRRGKKAGNIYKFGTPLWDIYFLITEKRLPNLRKKELKDSLVYTHCYYLGVGLSPMLDRLVSTKDYLPDIRVKYPKMDGGSKQ